MPSVFYCLSDTEIRSNRVKWKMTWRHCFWAAHMPEPTSWLLSKFVSKLLSCPSSDFLCVWVWDTDTASRTCSFVSVFNSRVIFCPCQHSAHSPPVSAAGSFVYVVNILRLRGHSAVSAFFHEASFKNSSIKVNYRGASWKLTHACNCHSTLPVDFVTPELQLLPYMISFFYFIHPKCFFVPLTKNKTDCSSLLIKATLTSRTQFWPEWAQAQTLLHCFRFNWNI